MQIGVKSNNMQHIVGFTLTIRTVSFSLPANYIGRTIPATACSNMTLPWIRFAVWSACWRPRTRFVSPRSPPILEEWHCICTQRAVLKCPKKNMLLIPFSSSTPKWISPQWNLHLHLALERCPPSASAVSNQDRNSGLQVSTEPNLNGMASQIKRKGSCQNILK